MSFNNTYRETREMIVARAKRSVASRRRSKGVEHIDPFTTSTAPTSAPIARRHVVDPLEIEQRLDALFDKRQAELKRQQRAMLADREVFRPRVYVCSKRGRIIGFTD